MATFKMWNYFYIFNLLYCVAFATLTYNTFTRTPATTEEIAEFEEKNIADICTVTFEPCDENEWRRVDGSCNNLKYPSHGTIHTPEWRMLPANYSDGYGLRKMTTGEDFPLARYIRLMLLKVGDGIDQKFATSASYFIEFVGADIITIHDIQNYVLQTTYCCEAKGLTDPMCAPNYIPENDNVHRFSHHKCINMTRPQTFQTEGCAPKDTLPTRINRATTHWDLSMIYYYDGNASAVNNHRTYEGGKLKVEVVNGIALPSDRTESTTCLLQQARETGCTRYVPNSVGGTNMFTTWCWRFHNHVADKLAELNPCWKDKKLFHYAMDITIALLIQILLYEFYGEVLGRENLMKDGILHSDEGFRDIYDEDVIPGTSIEYAYALRWFHTTQDGIQLLYDKYGNVTGKTQMVNMSLRVQDLAYDDNMVGYTHGLFNQPAGAFGDNTIHPDMADLGLGPMQETLDLATNDLAKGRHFGLPPYIHYRDFCTNYTKEHLTYEDLKYILSAEYIDALKRVYGPDARNIEAMAGMWGEGLMKGAWVPPTTYCMLVSQLKRTIVSDRHLYERETRPYAFTAPQLAQIRAGSFATLLCTVGDEVTEIQPKAFLRIGPGNEKVSCDEIHSIDFSPWKDDCCSK